MAPQPKHAATCNACGALIGDSDKHRAFHNSLTKLPVEVQRTMEIYAEKVAEVVNKLALAVAQLVVGKEAEK